ncbi:MAG: hypothetical protein V3V18_15460 [Methylococcales bacterium]
MKQQIKHTFIANAIAVGCSLAIAGTALAGGSTLTRSSGAPVGNNQNSLTAGPFGPTLLQDHHLINYHAYKTWFDFGL